MFLYYKMLCCIILKSICLICGFDVCFCNKDLQGTIRKSLESWYMCWLIKACFILIYYSFCLFSNSFHKKYETSKIELSQFSKKDMLCNQKTKNLATYRERAGSWDPEKFHFRLPNPEFLKSRDLINSKCKEYHKNLYQSLFCFEF